MGNFLAKLFYRPSENKEEPVVNNEYSNYFVETQEEEVKHDEDVLLDIDIDSNYGSYTEVPGAEYFAYPESEKKNEIFSTGAKKALLIGINYDMDAFENDDLNGCVNDMNNLRSFLKTHCGFEDKDFILLCNETASKVNIELEISNLVAFSYDNPNAEIWFSYSGHGTNIDSLIEEDGKSEVICPCDYLYNGIITDSWLQEHFVKILEQSTKVFVLMDCCNSGSNLNLPYRYKYGDVCRNDSNYNEEELKQLCKIVKISGCEDDQTSADYYESRANEFQGALTNGFLHFAEGGKSKTIDFYNNILAYLTIRGFSQKPVLTFSHNELLNSTLY